MENITNTKYEAKIREELDLRAEFEYYVKASMGEEISQKENFILVSINNIIKYNATADENLFEESFENFVRAIVENKVYQHLDTCLYDRDNILGRAITKNFLEALYKDQIEKVRDFLREFLNSDRCEETGIWEEKIDRSIRYTYFNFPEALGGVTRAWRLTEDEIDIMTTDDPEMRVLLKEFIPFKK